MEIISNYYSKFHISEITRKQSPISVRALTITYNSPKLTSFFLLLSCFFPSSPSTFSLSFLPYLTATHVFLSHYFLVKKYKSIKRKNLIIRKRSYGHRAKQRHDGAQICMSYPRSSTQSSSHPWSCRQIQWWASEGQIDFLFGRDSGSYISTSI